MSGGSGYRQTVLICQPGDDASQPRDVCPRFLDIPANTRADFDHRLNHWPGKELDANTTFAIDVSYMPNYMPKTFRLQTPENQKHCLLFIERPGVESSG